MSKNKIKNIPLPNNVVLKDYTLIKRISRGGFSFVYLARNNINGETVAIKEYMPNSMKIREKGQEVYISNSKNKRSFEKGVKQFFEEMSIISHIRHNNIINIIDYFELNNTAYIVTPYEYGNTLLSFGIETKKDNNLIKESDLLKIMIGVLEAVRELHNNGILHLDLKPNNIWLRPNKEILILDFGTSLDRKNIRENQFFHTPGYAAIEQYKKEYNNPLDIGVWTDYYGIGTTFYFLLTFKSPQESIKLKESLDINKVTNKYHYKINETINKLCQLRIEDRKKININEIIKELKNIIPFDYDDKKIEQFIINDI